MSTMKTIEIEKITLNIGAGKPGPELEKGKMLLEKITGAKPCETMTKKRLPAWNLRPGLVNHFLTILTTLLMALLTHGQ